MNGTAGIGSQLPQPGQASNDEAPPLLGRWSRVYLAILVYLAALVSILSLITRAFTY